MLNKNYLKYLFKSKKYFLLFILLVQAILTISNLRSFLYLNSSIIHNPVFIGYVIGLIIAFVLPLVVFSYVHNKKAIDTFYPLNMSRKEMLVTGVVFSFLVAIITYLVSVIILLACYIVVGRTDYIIYILWTLPLAILVYLMIVVFNVAIYLLANTLFDGVVILGAYSLLSVALYVLLVTYQDTFLIGTSILDSGLSSDILVYLSPVALGGMSFLSLNSFLAEGISISESTLPIYLLVIVLYIVIFGITAYKEYTNRNTERAGNYSNEFFAYPFVIGIYTVLSLFFIACQINMLSNISETLLFLVVIFALYVIANFIYKRKFSINSKQVILFVLAMGLSFVFNIVSVNTRGFELSYNYDFDYDKMSYTLEEYNAGYGDTEDIDNFIRSLGGDIDNEGYDLTVKVKSNNKEVVDIMESYRKKAIDGFYNTNFGRNSTGLSSTLFVSYEDKNSKRYPSSTISLDDLKKLLSLDNQNVYVSYYKYEDGDMFYIIYEDGGYQILNETAYSVYTNYDYQTAAELQDSFTKTEETTED